VIRPVRRTDVKVDVCLRLGAIPRIFASCNGCDTHEDHRADQVSFSGFDEDFRAAHAACPWPDGRTS